MRIEWNGDWSGLSRRVSYFTPRMPHILELMICTASPVVRQSFTSGQNFRRNSGRQSSTSSPTEEYGSTYSLNISSVIVSRHGAVRRASCASATFARR